MEHLPLDQYYVQKDWKAIPDDVCQLLLEYMQTSSEQIREIYPWQKKGHSHYGEFAMHDAPDFIWEWCKENLPLDFNQYVISVQVVSSHECKTHIDSKLRASSFNFVLTDDRAVTSWYDDTQENILHSVQYKPRTWYHHQGSIYHRVTGIKTPPRIGVTIYKLASENN